MSSIEFNITNAVQRSVQAGMQRGMEQAANELVHEVTQKLAETHGFDVDEAMNMLGMMSLETKKTKKVSKKVSSKKNNVALQLPWCGQVLVDCCKAIKSCNKLYTQCMNAKQENDDYCKRCRTTANKNNGKMPYGVIQDRMKDDYTDKDGKKPVSYGNYMRTKGIERADAEAEATKLGWTIPEEQFIVVEIKKGRKPKSKKDNVETSDTEDEKKDLFKEAAQAEMEESSDDESSDDDEPLVEALKKKRKTDGTNGPAAKSPKRVRKEEEEEENSELEEEEFSDQEEEADVEPFEHKGKNYLIDKEDTVYDAKTHEPVGEYDRENDALTIF